jgi:hypothetical protein
VLIRRCVASVSGAVTFTRLSPASASASAVSAAERGPAPGRWVHACAPVRFDLAGGWSDTPPISYERGGAVVNVALTIEGQCPVGASARLIPLSAPSAAAAQAEPVVLVLRTGCTPPPPSHAQVCAHSFLLLFT